MDNLCIPELKPTIQCNIIENTIYLRSCGEILEIDDDTGVFRHLLKLLDGKNDLATITRLLKDTFIEVTPDEVHEFIQQLDDLYLLEDKRFASDTLDEYAISRWQRNINFFGSFCHLSDNKYTFQQKLMTAKVALLGLGGLGSHLLFDLAAVGVHNLTLVEFDKVEISNLNRQILYTEADIGKSKAHSAKERILQFNSKLNINLVEKQLSSTDDVLSIIKGHDIVICVADRPKMEILDWVNRACVQANVPLVTGGLDTQVARYYSIIPGKSGCIACWRGSLKDKDSFSDMVLQEQRRTQLRGDNAAFVSFVSLLTGVMLAEAVKILTGISSPVALGKVLELNFNTMSFYERENWNKSPNCPICGSI